MAELAKRHATYADIEALPENIVGEIIDGLLHTHPRPMPRHTVACSALGGEITGPFQKGKGGPGGWIFADEPELHLGGDVIVPDLAGWRRERLSILPEAAYFDIAPDWVCEIASPSTAAYDRGPKRRIYGEAGVAFMWILEPGSKLLEAFVLTGGNWLLAGTVSGSEQVSLPPFDAISFPLGALFPLDLPDNETDS